jgi:HEAT repeat protein
MWLLVFLAAPGTLAADGKADRSDAAGLESLWADLAGGDAVQVARATLKFAVAKDAVAFLQGRLEPVKVDRKAVAQLLEQLDSEKFEEREQAARKLAYLNKYIKADLEKVLSGKPTPEVKKRVTELLDKLPPEGGAPAPAAVMPRGRSVSVSNMGGEIRILIDGKPLDLTPQVARTYGPPSAWVRAARAAAILEQIGTPAARKVLEEMAGGEKDALPSQAAREALERMKK